MNKQRNMWRILSLLLLLSLSGCKHQASLPKSLELSIELIGSWSNDSGCSITFARDHGNTIVRDFRAQNPTAQHLQNVVLHIQKNGVITQFASVNHIVQLSGTYLEGQLLIDHYCSSALYKTGR